MRDAADSQLHVPEHFSKVGGFDQDAAAVPSANASVSTETSLELTVN